MEYQEPFESQTGDERYSIFAASAKKIFMIQQDTGLEEAFQDHERKTEDCVLLYVAKDINITPQQRVRFFVRMTENVGPLRAVRIEEKVDLDYIQSLLEICGSRHEDACSRTRSCGLRRLRVIDCQERKLAVLPKSSTPYLTLSYLWGDDFAVEHTLGDQELLPTRLPLTIDDSILLTIHLGYRYLWIDRYCIRQHHNAEKNDLIGNMGRIYSGSSLTIIAASGENPNHGLPGLSRLRSGQAELQSDTCHLLSVVNPRIDIEKTKWNTRGWTYQEGLLARRRLIFTDHQVYFQCASMHCYESFSVPLDALHIGWSRRFPTATNMGRAFPRKGVVDTPHDIEERIQEYMCRHLTFDSDGLAAFYGILGQFSASRVGFIDLHGLPIWSNTSQQLRWEVPRSEDAALPCILNALLWTGCAGAARRSECPSWTWVGWRRTPHTTVDFAFSRYFNLGVNNARIHANITILSRDENDNVSGISAACEYAKVQAFLRDVRAPRELILEGWCFRVSLSWVEAKSSRSCEARLDSVIGPVAWSDIGQRPRKEARRDHFTGILLHSRPTMEGDLCHCLLLGQTIDLKYERIALAEYNIDLSKIFEDDFSRVRNDDIRWRKIRLV